MCSPDVRNLPRLSPCTRAGSLNGCDVAKAGSLKQRSANRATAGKSFSPSFTYCAVTTCPRCRYPPAPARRQARTARPGAARTGARAGRKPLGGPVPAPVLDRLGIGAERCGEMIADPRRHQRMRVCNRHQRQRFCVSPLLRIQRDQPRLGLQCFEIFDDRQRLEDRMAVVDERRHNPSALTAANRRELLAGQDVDLNFLNGRPLSLSATRTRKEAIDRQKP